MRRNVISVLVVMVLMVSACGETTDDSVVTTVPGTEAPVSTTSTSPVETTTTTVATTTTAAPTTTTTPVGLISVEVESGEVTVTGTPSVALGDEVTILVTSDVADEVHVHTYDVLADVEPGEPVEIRFVADIPGVHEVELEGAGITLLELEVGG